MLMGRRQSFHFGLADTLLAEAGGVPLDALHRDVDAICRCHEAAAEIARRLHVPAPRPHIAGFSYTHVSTLGAHIVFPPGSEPNVIPVVHSSTVCRGLTNCEEIDRLREPTDYLTAGIAPQRLDTMRRLRERCPDADIGLDHAEGPLTTAALLMGQDFFVLPYVDPESAHRLLSFVVRSCLNYNRAVTGHFGEPQFVKPRQTVMGPGAVALCDDFAGVFAPEEFAEFVVPYWDQMYRGGNATKRHLHSELLRKEHLSFLAHLGITVFDPSADQYVTPELLREHCPVPFTSRIQAWDVRDKSARELQALYRRVAACEPVRITFYMVRLAEEQKIRALLDVARELQ
jgi:hypothetical protein